LPPELQRFFARLSVFRGGWTAEAAEEVCEEPLALDYLAQLREASLVLSEEGDGEMRFSMLETLREFAAERLSEAPEGTSTVLERHLDFFRALVSEAKLYQDGPEYSRWMKRLEREHDNIRSALAAAVAPADNNTDAGAPGLLSALILACRSARFWQVRGHLSEGRRWLSRLLERVERSRARRRPWSGGGGSTTPGIMPRP
jgi:non-specific serine/threonine protein kinase